MSALTYCGDMVEKWVVPCRNFLIQIRIPETALAIERALCKLDNRILSDGLEIFRLVSLKTVNHIDYAINLRTFTPLMCFSGLKHVDLPSFCVSLLDDDALGSIVKSWPRLERLHLGTEFLWKVQPRLTFQSLMTALLSCPNLRELGLVFVATKLDPLTVKKLGGGGRSPRSVSGALGLNNHGE
ncbi:hypothetical protein K503DRAFT_430007 [Rhizopogon vinicolor AM-OR11-026]|uniref:F-box domain-containing protein n=1 Tax=Rhizopogon vinicolor AM-OR11-026 TaxID=1314800 RepID=A0A1B7MPU4_9AGAM|nr:hypothetical protein K503DRAFT_430007 [Rhizopogon vinicolor AM-OR11-026]